MKSKLFIFMALILSVLFTGCGGDTETEKENISIEDVIDEGGEKSDGLLEEAEDKAKQQLKEEDLSWPVGFMPSVPKFNGEISNLKEKTLDHMYVAYRDLSQEKALVYVDELKEAGFINEADEYISSTIVNFEGYNKEGNFVKFRWSENGHGTIDMIYHQEE